MKKLVVAIAAIFATSAFAYTKCVTQPVATSDGKIKVCQTCCNNFGVCQTYCS